MLYATIRTPKTADDPNPMPQSSGWSNRLLLAAIAGILFLTLYPFRFSIHPHVLLNSSPFLLGRGIKRLSFLDFFLNVLLFLPFGFGISYKLRQKNWSPAHSAIAAAVAGAVFSYAIEFAQIYIPPRDSGWEDVFSNSTGAALGALLFIAVGTPVFRRLSQVEGYFESWLTAPRVWILLFAYFGVWFLFSAWLQQQTNLANWELKSSLIVGNDGSLESPWRGQLLRLQIWDHAISERQISELAASGVADAAAPPPLADYNFMEPPPIPEKQGRLSPLAAPVKAYSGKSSGHSGNAGPWLVSESPVNGLVSAIQKSNQFTVRMICRPFRIGGEEGAIVSIAELGGKENLTVGQDGATLNFWFRSGVTTNQWRLPWPVPGVFSEDQVRDIVVSYDGSNVSAFMDGKKERRSPQLGPGVALAKLFHRGKPGEVPIYNDIYYLAVFVPAGCLLGIFARKAGFGILLGPLLASLAAAPILLETVLVHSSGRPWSKGNLALSFLVVALAALWINADQPRVKTN